MIGLSVILNGGGALSDVPQDKIAETHETVRVIGLDGGMQSGKPSVMLALPLPHDQGMLVAQTSLALFLAAADALKAKFGDPRV